MTAARCDAIPHAVRYGLAMFHRIMTRDADDADRGFVAGLAVSLLEFRSPHWPDPPSLARGLREALMRAVDEQGPGRRC